MKRVSRLLFPLVIAASCLPVFAHADEKEPKGEAGEPELEIEHIFGFADGSDIGAKGEREIEMTTIGGFGRIGSYNTVDNETSFRYGVSDRLRLSIGTLSDYYGIHGVPGLDNRSEVSFSGLIAEMRWNIVDHSVAPFGMSLSINPAWRQFDPDAGGKTGNYAIPVTLLLDKEIIPRTFFMAANLVYAPSFLRVNGARGHDDELTAIVSASYGIAPNIFLGAELRHENLAENGTFDAHALYFGPSLFYRLSDDFSVKVAWAAQIPDVGSSRLDLVAYERHQVDLLIAYHF